MSVSSTLIQWKRSIGGCTESKCGRFEIRPVFMGHTTPQAFHLFYRETPDSPVTSIRKYANTQREAKDDAWSYLVWGKR